MKNLTVALGGALLLVSAATFSLAQDQTNPPASALEKPADPQDASGSGTAPEGIGSTGWTGGSRSDEGKTTGSGSDNNGPSAPRTGPGAAENQPVMATGVDLNGPPTRFRASETPE
jgi:hypothetical protein